MTLIPLDTKFNPIGILKCNRLDPGKETDPGVAEASEMTKEEADEEVKDVWLIAAGQQLNTMKWRGPEPGERMPNF